MDEINLPFSDLRMVSALSQLVGRLGIGKWKTEVRGTLVLTLEAILLIIDSRFLL